MIVVSCKQKNNASDDSEKTKSEAEKKVSKRDYSINATNAYSDIFFDSLQLEESIVSKNLSDTLSRRMRSFYNARNFQFAWFDSKGLTYQAFNFWNLHEYYTTYSNDQSLNDKSLKNKMNFLVADENINVNGSDKNFIKTELTLTEHFIKYLLTNYKNGEIKRKEMERFIPLKKQDALFIADSLLTKKHKDNKYYSDVNEPYKLLKVQLQKYFTIVKNNGWTMINVKSGLLKKGTSAPEIRLLKKRLEISGEMPAGDSTDLFTDGLENAIKIFQKSHGFSATGIVTSDLLKELNVTALQRLQQILINMDRMRWVFNHTEGNLIEVNIPEFILHVYEGKKEAFNMPVVVGKEGHNTTIFTGNLNQVVFSPYWNVTPSIIAKEILPAIEKNPNYLEKNNMEQTGEDENGLPVIRQLPGPKNSLGKVKFLFPNSYNIYFHDTPAKDLFNMDRRAYSHGCIRLSDPTKMATYLLRNQKEWTQQKIDEAMNAGVEQVVRLKAAIPVLITYYTAWVDANGVLNFRGDVYKHDAEIMRKMFL